jgi:hypothetical protein
LGMELSPKGSVFGEGLSRKRTVQEASWPSSAFYNSSSQAGKNDRKRGACNAQAAAMQHPRDYSARTTRPGSHSEQKKSQAAPSGVARGCAFADRRMTRRAEIATWR